MQDECGQITKLPGVRDASILIEVEFGVEVQAPILAEHEVFCERREHGVGCNAEFGSLCVHTRPCRPSGDGLHRDHDGTGISCVQIEAGALASRFKPIASVHGPSVIEGGVLTEEGGQPRPRHFKFNVGIGAQHVGQAQRKLSDRRHGHGECQRLTGAHQRLPGHVVGRRQGQLDVRGVEAVDCRESRGGG